ncbi:DNA/RNA non-specific endonuclease, partial [Pseudomonadota bacterium]
MTSIFKKSVCLLAMLVLVSSSAWAAKYKPIIPDDSYNHDQFVTVVTGEAGSDNHRREFRAYVSVFDGADDDNGDGEADLLGVPHFVAYQMKKYEGKLPKGPKRPSPWITDKELNKDGIAPKDASYKHSRAFLSTRPNWYVRGHLCMKHHAWRLGKNADWNTHTTINAVPQRQKFNAGIWLDLENKTAKWADEFDSVWIVDGPIFEP